MRRRSCVIRDFVVALCCVCLSALPSDAVAGTGAAAPPSYGGLLLQLVLVVIGVCGLAYVVLRFGLKRLVVPDRGNAAMEVVARLPVEPRRSILVVRIVDRFLVVGSSEAGFERLGELESFDADEPAEPRRFADILKGRGDNS